MRDEAVDRSPAPIVGNWLKMPLLFNLKDDFGRSERKWGGPDYGGAYSEEDRKGDLAQCEKHFAALGAVRQREQGFFDAHHYEWAFEIVNYQSPVVGNTRVESQSLRLQVFALQALAAVWKSFTPGGGYPSLDNICARWAFSTEASPLCTTSNGFRYVVFSWEFQFLVWQFLGLMRASYGVESELSAEETIARLIDGRTVGQTVFCEALIPHRLARLYAKGDPNWMQQAEQHLFQTIPDFAGMRETLYPPQVGAFEAGLEELITSFAVYHEISHTVSGHRATGTEENEWEADEKAFLLFYSSWGWRADGAAKARLDDACWIMMGPIAFLWVLEMILRLDVLVLPTERRGRHLEGIERLTARSARLLDRMTKIMSESVVRFGVKIDLDALDRLGRFGKVLRDSVNTVCPSGRSAAMVVAGVAELQ